MFQKELKVLTDEYIQDDEGNPLQEAFLQNNDEHGVLEDIQRYSITIESLLQDDTPKRVHSNINMNYELKERYHIMIYFF
jgi:hypothetical protein